MKLRGTVVLLIAACMLFTPLFAAAKKKAKTPEEEPEESSTFLVPPVREPDFPPLPEVSEKPALGTIGGRVVHESGAPAAGVDVFCINEAGESVARTVTDNDGYYEFRNLPKGEYTISVSYSGISGPIIITFPGASGAPAPPAKLEAFEIGLNIQKGSYVRAQWSAVPQAGFYRCELYRSGEQVPIVKSPDIKQTFFEFEGLEENTEYEIRVFAKNSAGYSAAYTSVQIRTLNKPPTPPFGLGVTSAKNNRIDLIWNGGRAGELAGYVIQVKRDSGPYLYFTPQGYVREREKAYLVKETGRRFIEFTIEGVLPGDVPLIENLIPYAFRVIAVDATGLASEPSAPVVNIIAQDTVPPASPSNIKYAFVGENRLRITWDVPSPDAARYRLYYGVEKDRWDGVAYTEKNSYDLIVLREKLRDRELYVSLAAIDKAGNESGLKPYAIKTELGEGEKTVEEIVLAPEHVYRDYSFAIRPYVYVQPKGVSAPRKVEEKTEPKRLDFTLLRDRSFVIRKGEKAVIDGKVTFPENALILVESGGALFVENAEMNAGGKLWGGIRFLKGSTGRIKNTVISGAAAGIALLNNDNGVELANIEITGSQEAGLYIKNSKSEISFLTVRQSRIGLFAENSRVSLASSLIENNDKGILSNGYSLTLVNTKCGGNSDYGLRVYGGLKVQKSVFRENLAGIVIEEGTGSAEVSESTIELNRIDGIVVNKSNAELRGNLISNNGRRGVYIRGNANPRVIKNDIINNGELAVFGGGRIIECFIAYNNGSSYSDDTSLKGLPDNVFSSSSSGIVKQILNADYIYKLAPESVLR